MSGAYSRCIDDGRYAFIEFERSGDADDAYRRAHRKEVHGRHFPH